MCGFPECICLWRAFNPLLVISVQVLETLRTVSSGDLRKAITILQSASQLYGPVLDASYIVEIAGILPQGDAERMWRAIREPRFEDLRPVVRVALPGSHPPCVVVSMYRAPLSAAFVCV